MDNEKLKKTVCLNLRSVIQSSKGGVPLHSLQSDYKCLIGTDIPLQELGYNSLSIFLKDNPDTISLKKNKEGLLIAEAVPDATTAHIAKLISKQKGPKVPKMKSSVASAVKKINLQDGASSESVKKKKRKRSEKKKATLLASICNASRLLTSNTTGYDNHTNDPDNSQDISKKVLPGEDKENLKKAVMINLRCVTMSAKGGVLLENLQRDYQDLIGTPIPFKTLGHSSLENFIRSIPDVISLKKKNEQLIAEGVPDATTAHIANLISRQKATKKLGQKYVPMHASKKMEQNSKKRATSISKPLSSKEPLKEKLPVKTPIASCNSTDSMSDNTGPKQRLLKNDEMVISPFAKKSNIIVFTDYLTKDSIPFARSKKPLECFPCIVENIRKAMFSTLLSLHNLLFGIPYMDCLQEKILTFAGHVFPEGSEDWKKQEFLLSVLPLNGLKEYLDLLCIKYDDKEEKHALLNKLMRFLAAPNAEFINAEGKIDRKLSDIDLYNECQEKDKLISEIVKENLTLKVELLKMKKDRKNDLQVVNLQNEVKKLTAELDITKSNLTRTRNQKKTLGYTIHSLQGHLTQMRKEKKATLQALKARTSELEKSSLPIGSVFQTNVNHSLSKNGTRNTRISPVTVASSSKS